MCILFDCAVAIDSVLSTIACCRKSWFWFAIVSSSSLPRTAAATATVWLLSSATSFAFKRRSLLRIASKSLDLLFFLDDSIVASVDAATGTAAAGLYEKQGPSHLDYAA